MPTMISFTLRATFSETRKYTVIDKICDGVTVFDNFLSQGDEYPASGCAENNNSNKGRVSIKRSDGPLTEKDVYDGDIVDLG